MRKRKKWILFRDFIFIALLVAVIGRAETARMESFVKDGAYITPHFRWALPFEGEPLKVLFISTGTGSRDIWDLAQRIPIKHTVFEIDAAKGEFGLPEMFAKTPVVYEKRRSELNAILDKNRFDLIVLGNVAWSSLPVDIVYKITEQAVNGGAGIVQTNADFRDPMLEKLYTQEPVGNGLFFKPFPFEALERGLTEIEFNNLKEKESTADMLNITVPYHQPDKAQFGLTERIKCYKLKKGRFVSIQLPFMGVGWEGWVCIPSLIPGIPVNMRNLWQEEYYYMLVAKTFIWAAGRTPSAKIVKILPENGKQETGTPLAVTVEIALSENIRPFDGRIIVDVKDSVTGRYIGQASGDINVSSTVSLTMPILALNKPDKPLLLAADAFIHVRLFRENKISGKEDVVVDFGTGFIRAVSAKPIQISLDKKLCSYPEPVVAKVKLPDETKIDKLEIELYDSRGRIWEKKTVDVEEPGNISVSIPTNRTKLLTHGIRTTAYCKNVPIDTKDVFFMLHREKLPEDYYVCVQDAALPVWHALRRMERAYEWGADGQRTGGNLAGGIICAMAGQDMNISHRPRITPEIFLSPQKVKEMEITAQRDSAIFRYFNQRFYGTADDTGPMVSNVYPYALPLFREWLSKEAGGDIRKVNSEWSTDFKSFNEITADFITSSKKKNVVPAWVDYCRFINDSYIETLDRCRAALKKADSGVAAGVDAIYYYHSLASIYRSFDYIMPYYRPTDVEMARSLSKAGSYTGVCMGYGANTPRPFHRYLPWHILLAGNNSILYYQFSEGLHGDLVYGDTPGTWRSGWMMEEISNIKLTGLGKFLNSCKRTSSGIAILYSESSRRAQDADAPFSKLIGNVDPAGLAFQEMLSDHGLSYNYISSECIKDLGVLEKGDIRLLVLPHVQSMSTAEAERIRVFVKKGGAVLADVRPAIRTERGRRLAEGQIDEVFGIRRREDTVVDTSIVFPGNTISVDVRADAAVTLAGGSALMTSNNLPLFVENRYGNGKAVLMNIDAAFLQVSTRGDAESATTARQSAPALASYEFIGEILMCLGMIPRFNATLDDKPSLGVKLTEFRKDDAKILAVEVKPITGYKYPQKLRIELGGKYYIVEMRSGRVCGWNNRIEIDVNPYDILLFSLLDKQPSSLEISVPSRVFAGTTFDITAVRGNTPDTGIIQFRLTDPEGITVRDYTSTVFADGKIARDSLCLPYNAITGKWKLTVSDLLTGLSASETLTVEGKASE